MPRKKIEQRSDYGSLPRTFNLDLIAASSGAKMKGRAILFVVQVDSMVHHEILFKTQTELPQTLMLIHISAYSQ
jgi:hypothetical protein